MTKPDSTLKNRDFTLPTKVHLIKAVVFPVVMYGCQSWTVKKAECRRIDAFELWCWRRLFESPLDCKEIQPVHQSWVFISRTDVETETSVLWPPDAKNSHLKRPWCWERLRALQLKQTTEDQMVGWHHRPDRHGFGWIPGVGDGQGGLAWCSSWGSKMSHTTGRLNWTECHSLYRYFIPFCYQITIYCYGYISFPLPLCSFKDFSCSSVGKESACSAGDQGLIPGLGRCPG